MTDNWTHDGRTDGQTQGSIIVFSHTLIMREIDVASLVEIRDSVTDRWTDGGRTE